MQVEKRIHVIPRSNFECQLMEVYKKKNSILNIAAWNVMMNIEI